MPDPIQTQRLEPTPEGIARAAAILQAGGRVAFPTETVYGLGADSASGQAVASIYEAKDRPAFNPLIVHLPDADAARRLVEWTNEAETLASAFWPGPLTLVLPLRPGHGIASVTTAGLPTLGIRVPAHPLAQALLREAGLPVAAPSANPSGRISATTADHVMEGLSTRIEAVLDGGPSEVGLESTIVGLADTPTLLRPGGLPAEAIAAALGHHLARRNAAAPVTAPGQTASHYAPDAVLRLNATETRPGERLLGFGPMPCDLNLSPAGDLREAAANLFGHLHRLDAAPGPIAVAPIPDRGLGAAINDRLARAAAPRG